LTEYVANCKNIPICGATSSGKTTLTNILTNFVPDDQCIVLIEDTAEIQIPKQNVLRFDAGGSKAAFQQSQSEIF